MLPVMTQKAVEVERRENRAEVFLNRPESLNAVNTQLTDELNTAMEDVQADDSTEVVILTGRGRGFCSGADTNEMETRTHTPESYRKHLWTIQNVLQRLYGGPKPTIAAINGPAVGAGFSLAMAADFRVMNEEAILNDQHTNIGLVPGGGTPYLLTELVGESKAKEIVLTGKLLTAEEADEVGLLAEIASDGQTLEEARNLASHLQQKSTAAVQNTKALFGHMESFEQQLNAAFDYQWECLDTEDHQEAVKGDNK